MKSIIPATKNFITRFYLFGKTNIFEKILPHNKIPCWHLNHLPHSTMDPQAAHRTHALLALGSLKGGYCYEQCKQ